MAAERVYDPLGLDVKWLPGGVHDSLVGGARVLHRVAKTQDTQRGDYVNLDCFGGLAREPDHVTRHVDLFACLFATKGATDLDRVMLFPDAVFQQLPGSPGKTKHVLYPSTSIPGNISSRRKQLIQSRYEIDLSQPLLEGPQREKLERIFAEAGMPRNNGVANTNSS